MSRVLSLNWTLRGTRSISAARLPWGSYSTDKGGKQNDDTAKTKATTGTTNDESIVPMSMSYNSYENLSSVQTTPPILIMHGAYGVNKFGKWTWLKIMITDHVHTQVYSDQSKIGEVSAKQSIRKRIQRGR